MKESINQSLWGLPTTLTNYFAQLTDPDYHTQEILLLVRNFGGINHPISIKIQSLLNEVVAFRAATNPDFITERRESISADKVLEHFNIIGNTLENAEKECAEENKESNEYMVFNNAIEYALKSIKERLNNIKQNDEFLIEIYDNNPNQLKNILAKKITRPNL